MKAFVLLATLAVSACAAVPPVSAGPTAGFGQIAYSNGVSVRPVRLIEDSRCPANVQCVWAGRLIVRAEIIGGNWRQTRDLELGKPQPIADGILTLVAAAPQKAAPGQVEPGSYRFTFDFQGGL